LGPSSRIICRILLQTVDTEEARSLRS
jgi:hypothetical protein